MQLPHPNPALSHWIETTLGNGHPEFLRQHASRQRQLAPEYDVCIIGAGITGCSLALHLYSKRPELKIALLDARCVSGGATGRNGGLMWPSLNASWQDTVALYGEAGAARLLQFEEHAFKDVVDFIEANKLQQQVQFGRFPVGGITICESQAEMQAEIDDLLHAQQAAAAAGIKLSATARTILSSTQLHKLLLLPPPTPPANSDSEQGMLTAGDKVAGRAAEGSAAHGHGPSPTSGHIAHGGGEAGPPANNSSGSPTSLPGSRPFVGGVHQPSVSRVTAIRLAHAILEKAASLAQPGCFTVLEHTAVTRIVRSRNDSYTIHTVATTPIITSSADPAQAPALVSQASASTSTSASAVTTAVASTAAAITAAAKVATATGTTPEAVITDGLTVIPGASSLSLRAGCVVHATNGYNSLLPRLLETAWLRPVRNQVAVTRPLAQEHPFPDAGMYARSGYVYFSRRFDHRMVIGGFRDVTPHMEWGTTDDSHAGLDPFVSRCLRAYLPTTFPTMFSLPKSMTAEAPGGTQKKELRTPNASSDASRVRNYAHPPDHHLAPSPVSHPRYPAAAAAAAAAAAGGGGEHDVQPVMPMWTSAQDSKLVLPTPLEYELEWSGILGFTKDRWPLVGALPLQMSAAAVAAAATTCHSECHQSAADHGDSSGGHGQGGVAAGSSIAGGEFVCMGFSGHGMTRAFTCARNLALMLLGEKCDVGFPVREFDPARCLGVADVAGGAQSKL